MSSSWRKPSEAQVRRSAWQWLDGTIEERDFDRLKTELAASAEARRVFAKCVHLNTNMAGEAVLRRHVDELLTAEPPRRPIAARPVARPASRLIYGLFAAAASIGGLLAAWGLQRGGGPDAMPPAPGPLVAEIGKASTDCQWFFERRGQNRTVAVSGSGVRQGAAIRVVRGQLQLNYYNGAEVRLAGPALYETIGENRGRVLYGKCRARVADTAAGFALETPHAEVTDLGTEFGLEVSEDGDADVVVFDGAVDVDYGAVDGSRSGHQSLLVGEAFRLGASGSPVRLASITSDKFGSPTPHRLRHGRGPVIVSVEDNLRQSWKYYEIVPGGLGEDAKAFNDIEREHEWNGLTRLGMPEYLVGCDYVRMFKGDQIRHDLEIDVTLARQADLFILFDERVPAPAWLTEGFLRTGDRLGLDMGPWEGPTGDEYRNAIGPGASIDRVAVVWRSRRPVEGVIRLGSTETSILGTEMYGIAARPIPVKPERSRML